MADERVCLESPVFPIIVTVALLVECQQDSGAVNIFPFTSKDMAVIGLRRHRWRKRIHGSSSMNRRLGASCCEQRTGEKEERGMSLLPCQDDRPYAVRHSRVTGHGYSALLVCSCHGRIKTVCVIRCAKSRQVAPLWRSDLPAFTETITSQFLGPSESTARDSDRSRPPRYDLLGECFRSSRWCRRYANALLSRLAP